MYFFQLERRVRVLLPGIVPLGLAECRRLNLHLRLQRYVASLVLLCFSEGNSYALHKYSKAVVNVIYSSDLLL